MTKTDQWRWHCLSNNMGISFIWDQRVTQYNSQNGKIFHLRTFQGAFPNAVVKSLTCVVSTESRELPGDFVIHKEFGLCRPLQNFSKVLPVLRSKRAKKHWISYTIALGAYVRKNCRLVLPKIMRPAVVSVLLFHLLAYCSDIPGSRKQVARQISISWHLKS